MPAAPEVLLAVGGLEAVAEAPPVEVAVALAWWPEPEPEAEAGAVSCAVREEMTEEGISAPAFLQSASAKVMVFSWSALLQTVWMHELMVSMKFLSLQMHLMSPVLQPELFAFMPDMAQV